MKRFACVLAVVAVLVAARVASASSIQWDFGTTAGSYTSGTDAPAQYLGTLTGSDSTWNVVGGTGDASFYITSGLTYTRGASATGVWIEDGSSPEHLNTWTWRSGTHVAYTGSAWTPPCGPTALMGDAIYCPDNYDLGVQVGGLSPGTYDVYALIGSDAKNRSYQVAIGTNISTFAGSQGLLESSSVSVWTQGTNYAYAQVTVSSTSDYIAVLVDSSYGSNPTQWSPLCGLQIVGVPEPGTLVLLGSGLFGLLAYAWRRRR